MAKEKQQNKLYVAEMEVWLKQQNLRLQSCLNSVKSNNDHIAVFRQLNRLERKQAQLIARHTAVAAKELVAFKKKHGLK